MDLPPLNSQPLNSCVMSDNLSEVYSMSKSTILEAIYAFVYQGFFLTLKQLTFQRMNYTAADFDIEYTSERLIADKDFKSISSMDLNPFI